MSLVACASSDGSANPRTACRVLMPPAVMKESGFATGDPVLVRRALSVVKDAFPRSEGPERPPAVGVAWPSTALRDNEIGLSAVQRRSASLRLGDFVDVTDIGAEPPEARRLTLEPLAPFSTSDASFELYAQEALVDVRFVCKGAIVSLVFGGENRLFRIAELVSWSPPAEGVALPVCRSTRRTEIKLRTASRPPEAAKDDAVSDDLQVNYASIGGSLDQVAVIRQMVELPLKQPELFSRFGLKPPRGVLLFGPPGTGKTLLARAVAAEAGASVYVVNGAEIISKYYGETEKKLRDLFRRARETAPSIIFIDEIDALCPKRDEASGELEKRVVAALLTLMDGTSGGDGDVVGDRVVVIAATNRANSLDEALRRPGRFDREVEVGVPNSIARASILSVHLRQTPNTLSDSDVRDVASKAHGYVGADLAAVCREAGIKAVKKAVLRGLSDPGELKITKDDVVEALGEVRPSAMREILLEVPSVPWSSIGGQHEIKQKLRESVEWPLLHPEAFARMGIRPPKGILLYGPPGCSKTLLAKALATEGGLNFIAVKGPELFSKWVGESEKATREVFRKARAVAPSIIFFDEIDAITVKRGGEGAGVSDRVLAQLLSELDGVEPLVNVTVVAATNRPDIIDPALMRPGRIDRILYIGPPDFESRREILRIQIAKMQVSDDVDIDFLAERSEGCSGAEVVALCQEAALCAMDEDVNALHVSGRHFENALAALPRRITQEMISFYDQFRLKAGSRNLR